MIIERINIPHSQTYSERDGEKILRNEKGTVTSSAVSLERDQRRRDEQPESETHNKDSGDVPNGTDAPANQAPEKRGPGSLSVVA